MSTVRDALRALRATPVISVVAILSLALGIGANTAIFSILNSLVLRSLPVAEPDRLVLLRDGSWTNPIWEQIRDRQGDLFDGAFAWSMTRFDVAEGGETDLVDGLWASGRMFDLLGVTPVLGRTLGPADDARRGGPEGPVAVISYRFWQSRFGGRTDVLGQSLKISRVPFTIVGVTPPAFFGPEVGRSFDVAIPIGTDPLVRGTASFLDARSTWWLEVMARLKPDQDADTASQALNGVRTQIRTATLPQDWTPSDQAEFLRDPFAFAPAATGTSGLRTRYQQPLTAIMVVVGLVLLIACANIANLLLSRAAARRHEMSVRLALGASFGRLARQLFAESLLLAGIGAVLGLVFAHWGARLLVAQLSTSVSTVVLDLAIDWRVLSFTAVVSILTALLFGLAPASGVRRVSPNDALKDQSRGVVGERRFTLRHALVVGQVALSVVLVVAAGLFVQSFRTLVGHPLGLEPGRVLTVTINAQRSATPLEQRLGLAERLQEEVMAVPGVAGAGLSVVSPVSGATWNDILEVPGAPEMTERQRSTFMNFVSPGWFDTYSTRVLAGRAFVSGDRAGAPAVAVVNEAFVRRFMPGESPIGRRVRIARETEYKEIVGLVEDAVYRNLRDDVPPTMYQPLAQVEDDYAKRVFVLSVRAENSEPVLLTRGVVSAVGNVDRDLSMTVRTLSSLVDASVTQDRIVAMLSGFFGALALLLAGLGLYGVTSYAVNRRRTEIGVRLALGAGPARVIRLVMRRVGWLVAIGIAIGTGVSLWASRFVSSLLYGLEPGDPTTFVLAAVVLAVVGIAAGLIPARRAAQLDPATVIRSE